MNFDALMRDIAVDEIASKMLGFAKAAKLKIKSWFKGGTADQLVVVISQTIFTFSAVAKQAVRGQYLRIATDPGDPGDPETTPGPGWLSAKGENDYGTPRAEATFATGHVTLTGDGGVHTFGPFDLTFQNASTGKRYRNAEDPSIYTNPDGTFTLGIGEVKTIPIVAEEEGTASNAIPGDVSILTSTLGDTTVTNADPILGMDREDRDTYIARCEFAAAATSPNGPADKYRYIATSAREDGTFGDTPSASPKVNINRVQVTKDSATGIVDAWFAAPTGAPISGDFDVVNGLIEKYAVPDCVTYTGHMAVEDTIAITYTVECSATPGLTETIVKNAIAAALGDWFSTIPIGGYKQDPGGNGTVFVTRIEAEIGKGHKSVFDVTVTLPASDVSLTVGHVAVLGIITGTVTFS